MDYIDEIYYTLLDDLTEETAVPWVESIWQSGGLCEKEYGYALDARQRVCARLGVEEDSDLELMMDSLLRIQREVGRRMFLYGMRFRNEENTPRSF